MAADPTIFLSYSRRQLYFAESLALHLQQAGFDVWFDLQQLEAGSVWSEGLKAGVREADRLVLVVSKASLESEWTRAEWEGVVGKGDRLVLAVFEPVELPAKLRGLPTYDFRTGFEAKLRDLAAYLGGDGEPRHDPVPGPNRAGVRLKLPAVLWGILSALSASLITCLPAAIFLLDATFRIPNGGSDPRWDPWLWGAFTFCVACSVAVAIRYAIPFWRRSLSYKGLRRGLLWSLALLSLFALAALFGFPPFRATFYLPVAAWLVTSFVYAWPIRRSAALLRWMQPDEGLQKLRRRVHGPLASKSEGPGRTLETLGKSFRYALHSDAADGPLARYVERILKKEGHERVTAQEKPEHHLAILTNRSSQSWVEALTEERRGRLVYVIASTIELGDRLSDTARYQWVDFRSGDRRDIETLARSLSNPELARRDAGLEATPEMIHRWKVPGGVRLLRRVTELFGVLALVFGMTDVLGFFLMLFADPPEADSSKLLRSSLLSVAGVVFLWMAGKALVYRRIPAPIMYGLLVGVPVAVALRGNVLPDFLRCAPWVPLALYFPFVLNSLADGRYWLPGFARSHRDEVGIERSIERSFRKRNILKVSAWVVLIVSLAVGGARADSREAGPAPGGQCCRKSTISYVLSRFTASRSLLQYVVSPFPPPSTR